MTERIPVVEKILSANDKLAQENQAQLDAAKVFAINIMASPGAGKTSLIEATLPRLAEKLRVAVVDGDVATSIDADRASAAGAAVAVQVNTGGECHLDAVMLHQALGQVDLAAVDMVLVENVGNLICPAEFPLGTDKRVVVISVTEGPYMILKHPFTFINADVMVINKKDLAQTMKIDIKQLQNQAKEVKPTIKVAVTNALTGEGVEELMKALEL